MKGLELAELFFESFGLPVVRKQFPEMLDKVSAGLIGRGSEVLGADDDLSRDHGWGPRFCLFLNEGDFQRVGKEMERRLNETKPKEFEGIDLARHRTDPISVTTIDRAYHDLTGSAWPPSNLAEWAVADENGLCFARAGKIFYDPVGHLTARKHAFEQAYYPEPIWEWRVASKLHQMWDYGEYNIRKRLTKRNDSVAALVGQGYFVEAAMQLAFLLNCRFAPYWKWLHWSFTRLPSIANRLEPLLADLESSTNWAARAEKMGEICQFYREVLWEKDILPDSSWRNFMGSFEIIDHIQDTEAMRLIEEHFDRHKKL